MIRQIPGISVATDEKLLNEVLSLDKLNMEPILQSSGLPNVMPKWRVSALKLSSTEFFGAFEADRLVGYIEICRDWNNSAEKLYITSIQILPSHQNSLLLKRLIQSVITWASDQSFNRVLSEVQISNSRMQKILNRFGFKLEPNEERNSIRVEVSREALIQNKLFMRLSK